VPDTVIGRRDRAILLVFILTGRRRSEVMDMKAGDIEIEGGTVFYRYRGKGGKKGRRELPRPAWEAIRRTLDDCGKELATMVPGSRSGRQGPVRRVSRGARSTVASGATWWRLG
jgi:integrase